MYGLYQILYFTIIDIINTFKSPFFIIVLVIIFLQYYKIGKLEKENLGYKRSALLKLLFSTIWGVFGGIIATIIFIYMGVVAIPEEFMYILVVAIILSIINPRYMCFSYGGSVLSLISLVFGYPKIHISQVMSIVAVLHIVESILILLDGNSNMLPIFIESNNRIIGGYNMNRFWPIPFVIFIGDGLIYPITLVAILNYGDYSFKFFPKRKVFNTSIVLFIYSIILLFISKNVDNLYLPPLFALFGHEFIILQNKFLEEKSTPAFTPLNKGVKVMYVVPKSIAHQSGVKKGDVVLKINGVETNNTKDLENIMLIKSDNYKIELFNKKVGLSTKKYNGNKKSLGLITVPRDF